MSNTSSTLARLLVRRDVQIWLVILTAIGLVASFTLLPEDWSVARKLAAGVLFGVGSAYCAALPRMLGGRDYI
ncbi:MAG: hypothetical protein AAF211_01205 [Myxococcota bacterium]